MKIALINEFFPPFTPGGAEWSTLYLAQQLAQSEQVVVITPNYGAVAQEQMDSFVVERFAFPVKLSTLYGELANPAFYLYSALQIARQVRRYQFDILHVHNKQMLIGTMLAGMLTGVPAVASVRDLMILCRYGMCLNHFNSDPHGCDWGTYWRCLDDYLTLYMPGLSWVRRVPRVVMALYHRFDSFLKKAALRRMKAIVTISHKMGKIYRTRGLPTAKLMTIYNPAPAVTNPEEKKLNQEYHLLYAGKLSWGKGPHLLIDALPAIREALAPRTVRLTLAGKGPLDGQLKQRASERGMAADVHFCGQLPHGELQQLYREADLVVVPSVVQ
jgi:glycosyltransferase involved in cell wall biosynthesis